MKVMRVKDALCTSPRTGRQNGIDLVKLLMAFCVVAIHTDPFRACTGETWYPVYDAAVRCAVPFFFLSSGFLLGVRLQTPYADADNLPILRRSLWRYVKMYLLWTLIDFPFDLMHKLREGTSVGKSVLLFLHSFVFHGGHLYSWQLWYLLATIYAVLLILLLTRLRVPFRGTCILCAALYALGLFFDWLHAQQGGLPAALRGVRFLLDHSFSTGQIFRAFLYIALGMLFAQKLFRPAAALVLFAAGFAANCVLDGTAGELALAVCAAGLFCAVQALPLRDSDAYPFLRRMSTAIFFIHLYVWALLYTALYGQKTFGVPIFLLTSAACAVPAAGYAWIRERIRKKKRCSRKVGG